jgi:hypothetical protein
MSRFGQILDIGLKMPKILNKSPQIQKLKNSNWIASVLILEGDDVEAYLNQLIKCQQSCLDIVQQLQPSADLAAHPPQNQQSNQTSSQSNQDGNEDDPTSPQVDKTVDEPQSSLGGDGGKLYQRTSAPSLTTQ